jgi:UDP-N-acetylglucosamine--N-acetylmuramyl-(pentapeptide) pyrophosphoryl-undecaprenol N-acetylglucosamine transferase
MKPFRLVITGGGTGGHIMPGIAVVQAIRNRLPNMRVLWVGVKGRREEDIVPRYDIPLVTMRMHGLERSLSPGAFYRNAKTACQWISLQPILKARSILKEFAPDVILGTGGYVCAPVLIAGKTMGIRKWILEQNSVPGLTVKCLSKLADGIGIAYENTRGMLSANAPIILVGNPVSPTILTASREDGLKAFHLDPRLRTLLVIGGSLGSVALNRMVQELLQMGEKGLAYQGWQIIHSTGHKKFEAATRSTQNLPHYHPYPYLYSPELALAAADLVVCRGGAMTLAEVTARGVPAVIVPWPGAVRNHQFTNAVVLADAGAAILTEESRLSGSHISSQLNEFRMYPDRLKKLAENSLKLGRVDATDRIADLIMTTNSREELQPSKP